MLTYEKSGHPEGGCWIFRIQGGRFDKGEGKMQGG